MMDVRTLEIEEDWFRIAQDRQRQSTILLFCLSVGVGKVCAANRACTQLL